MRCVWPAKSTRWVAAALFLTATLGLTAVSSAVADPQLTAIRQLSEQLDSLTGAELRVELIDLEDMRRARHEAHDLGGEVEILRLQARINSRLGRLDEAIGLGHEALELARLSGHPEGLAATLTELGRLYAERGRPVRAAEYLQVARQRWQVLGDRAGETTALVNLGALAIEIGEPQQALTAYQAAIDLGTEADQTLALRNNLGRLYSLLGQPSIARQKLEEAQRMAPSKSRRQAEITANLGLAEMLDAQPEKASRLLEEAARRFAELGEQQLLAGVTSDLGLVRLYLDDPGGAVNQQLEALGLLGELDPSLEVVLRSRLGEARNAAGQHHHALRDLRTVLPRVRRLAASEDLALTLLRLARVEQQLGQLRPALGHVEEAIEIVDRQRAKLVSAELRASFGSWRTAYRDLQLEVLLELDALHPDAGWRQRALAASDSARSRALVEVLAAAEDGQLPPALAEERRLRRRISSLDNARRRLVGIDAEAPRIAALEAEITALLQRRYGLAARAPTTAADGLPAPHSQEPLDLEHLRGLLDPGMALLEYALGEERSYLFVLTKEGLEVHRLAAREPIEQAARTAHRLLARSRQRSFQGAAQLAARRLAELILPIELPARLVVVPDGALARVPFAALPWAGGGQQGAGHQQGPREVVVLPAASLLPWLRPVASQRVVVLADPVFDAGDPRLGGESHPATRLAEDVGTSQTGDGLISALRGAGSPLPRLPWSRREAEFLSALRPELHSALDFAANRMAFDDPRLRQSRVLHLATHALIDDQQPELSGLALSAVDPRGRPRDGFLRLMDIYQLRLEVDLVVLSGCRTALGPAVRGEGLNSLGRGFLQAGARRVLASLWDVDDRATAVFMESFYRALLSEGLKPSAALARAQGELRATPRWQAPYYWAGFALLGDWR